MARRRSSKVAVVPGASLLLAMLCALAPGRGFAADPPAAPPGPTYANKDLGFVVEGPSGWKLEESKSGVSAWRTLATFEDATSGSISVLSVRKAIAVTLSKLRAEITKAYADDKSFAVGSITDLPSNGRRPLAGLVVEASQQQPGTPAPPGPAGSPPPPPPPPVTWHVTAAYLLGGEYEYRLYTQVKSTLYSRLQPVVAKMIDTVTLKLSGAAVSARGEGTFRDETAGFACQYPGGYGVRLPERTMHLVEFAPAGAGPVLGVYRVDSPADLEAESKSLVDYYTGGEVGGEAVASQMEVAGRPAALVAAKGRVAGKDQVFFVAVVKRGNDTFRLRCSADATQETEARAAFDKFAKSFVLSNAATAPATASPDDTPK